jgi:hypothetical protein
VAIREASATDRIVVEKSTRFSEVLMSNVGNRKGFLCLFVGRNMSKLPKEK